MLTREAKQIASIAYLLAPRVSTKECLKPMKNATFQALLDSLPAISALFAIAEIQQVLPRVGCLYKVYSNPKYVASINQANKWALFYAHCSTQPHPPTPQQALDILAHAVIWPWISQVVVCLFYLLCFSRPLVAHPGCLRATYKI